MAKFAKASVLKRLVKSSRGVAQLAEHWFPKPAVAGSSPSAPAKNMWVGCNPFQDVAFYDR